MKTVTGKIVSSSPASVSTASSILTKFISTENGASQAVNAYLRRATAAFDELVRIHSKSDRKKYRKDKSDGVMRILEVSQEPGRDEIGSYKKEKKKEGRGEENESKKRKKKKKRESGNAQENGEENGVREGGDETVSTKENGEIGFGNGGEVRIGEGKEERRKKRKNREVDVVESGDDSVQPRSKKKKKRRRSSEGKN